MQVDPIKPSLKLPGFTRLKLNCDEPLSNFALKIMLRCYNQGIDSMLPTCLALALV